MTLYLAVNHGQDGLDLQRSANARSPRPDAPTASEELQRVHAKSNQARLALGLSPRSYLMDGRAIGGGAR